MQENTGRFLKGQIPHNVSDLNSLVQVGQMFGNWCVQSPEAYRVKGYRYIKVKCTNCGKEEDKQYDNLKSGKSTKCLNCGNRKYTTEIEHSLEKRYQAMMCRCHNPNDKHYSDYGGRGIMVSPELQDVGKYISYCISLEGADINKTIDRIDNSKGYEPGNLRWISQQEQARNTRKNVYVNWNNTEMVFQDFATNYTYLSPAFALKLYKQGWTLQRLHEHRPEEKGRRAQGIRLGKLRSKESVSGKKWE